MTTHNGKTWRMPPRGRRVVHLLMGVLLLGGWGTIAQAGTSPAPKGTPEAPATSASPASLAATPTSTPADETASALWLTDLEKALSEAEVKNKPVFAQFVTPDNRFCKLLEETTFSDPKIQKLLREEVIAVRLDMNTEVAAANRYNVTVVPTVVILSPQGQVRGALRGLRDAETMLAGTKEILGLQGEGVVFSVLEVIHQDWAEAERLHEKGDEWLALQLYRRLANRREDVPEVVQARQRVATIEQKAAEVLQQARAAAAERNFVRTAELLGELKRAYPLTAAGREAVLFRQGLEKDGDNENALRNATGEKLFKQAMTELRQQHYTLAMEHFQELMRTYPDLAVGERARWHFERLQKTPHVLRGIRNEQADDQANIWLSMARTWKANKRYDRAVECYQRVITRLPGTTFADIAEDELEVMQQLYIQPFPKNQHP